MKSITFLTEQSDFLTDFVLFLNELPSALFGLTKNVAKSIARSVSMAWRLVRSDKARFVMIIAVGMLIISLQLRSILG